MKACCERQNCGPESVEMNNLFELCSSNLVGFPSKPPLTKKVSKKVKIEDSRPNNHVRTEGSCKRNRSAMVDDLATSLSSPSPTSRSTRSSSVETMIEPLVGKSSNLSNPRPGKKRRTELETPKVVLKVHPSEFPKELHGAKDLDPSEQGDYHKVFTPQGAYTADIDDGKSPGFPVGGEGNSNKYQKIISIAGPENFYQCMVCNGGGKLLLCCKCPRAFHSTCLSKDGCFMDPDSLPEKWECHRCKWDKEIRSSDEISELQRPSMKLQVAYSKVKSPDQSFILQMLNATLEILSKLKSYDFGPIFSEPGESSIASFL